MGFCIFLFCGLLSGGILDTNVVVIKSLLRLLGGLLGTWVGWFDGCCSLWGCFGVWILYGMGGVDLCVFVILSGVLVIFFCLLGCILLVLLLVGFDVCVGFLGWGYWDFNAYGFFRFF